MSVASPFNGEIKLKKKHLSGCIVSIIILILIIGISAVVGAVTIPPGDVIAVLSGNGDPTYTTILLGLRLPRIIEAAAVGLGLSVSGVFFQGLLHNPMADPYILGISNGAALGATVAMVLGMGLLGTEAFAFATGLVTIYLVIALAKKGSRIPMTTMLLTGVAVSAFLSAVISLMMFFNNHELSNIVFWMMGGLELVSWKQVAVSLPVILAGVSVMYIFSREMNAIVMGEETAEHLGIDIERVKNIILVCGSLVTATAVSVSGIIGFVGLIIPHITRLLVGPDNRVLVPFSAVFGAIFLVFADTLSRTVVQPVEIPIGIITAAFGGPFFLYILRTNKSLT